ncbi:ParB N-terminal domain-containing protein [uncultured Thiocystis sp.]|jgi:ParB family chromosome partitioning protein|uniref:ParB N-terminal domain-containing protein n=1 Tax=uncultured Thiocystis sp. TaxID=1202134 RepID=UPI0025E9A130|nr:ParB N-terminal domain-containing protein [uncultured Thiocystis sp.]
MRKPGTPEAVRLIPINRIEVLNSRERNTKVFEEIVGNIKAIGLKKPITVTQREGADGEPKYILVCGEGRLNAFRLLGDQQFNPEVARVLRKMRPTTRPESLAVARLSKLCFDIH